MKPELQSKDERDLRIAQKVFENMYSPALSDEQVEEGVGYEPFIKFARYYIDKIGGHFFVRAHIDAVDPIKPSGLGAVADIWDACKVIMMLEAEEYINNKINSIGQAMEKEGVLAYVPLPID